MTDNAWATLDDLLGTEVTDAVGEVAGSLAFYGRCSTEDNQDPETSLAWQLGNATKFVDPLGGQIVAQYFDLGQSRSVPWERREQAARLLQALADPDRTWDAVVVGEGTRCWYGNQFSLTAPRFAHAGVTLLVPELGGVYDPTNPSHKMLMSVLGGMSESERQHVQARVRAAMDAQVLNEGRHQGGRAPYGYTVIDAGPHPNPRKSAEGYRLRVLALDDAAASVVRRIFEMYLEGSGDHTIASQLNREGISCPSAHTPRQNRHRAGDGWQASTVRAILENPRYTGYAFFGRWQRTEVLLNPNDVAAGHVVRFRRANKERVIRSRRPAHPVIVSVDMFTQVALLRRSRAGSGRASRARLERGGRSTVRPYPLRGLVRCHICQRKMQPSPRRWGNYYRCMARELAPGSPALAEHPPSVYLREREVLPPLNHWLATIFAPEHRKATISELVDAEAASTRADVRVEQMRKRLADAEARLRRHQAAIEAGVDPAALVEVINAAQAERVAAQTELNHLPPPPRALNGTEVEELLDEVGDVTAALDDADPADLADLYQALRLSLWYDPDTQVLDVEAQPLARVVSERVRGGT